MSSPDDPRPSPARPISIERVPWEEWSQGSRFGSRSRHLTSAVRGNDYRVGVQIEELAPGKQSVPSHYHLLEEEHLLVLSGSCTLRLGDERLPLREGDYACFPAGQRVGHCLVNEGTEPCRLLVIGERRPDEVCVYPDSGKVMVRALKEIYDRSALREYWDGERAEG
jgi:uncharacterized cupin superfamily protein